MSKEGRNSFYRAYADRWYLDRANRDTYLARQAAGDILLSGNLALPALSTLDGVDLSVHVTSTTGIHGVGEGALVGTGLTQTLTGKTLTSPTIQGTVGAGTGLTMPAFTAGGDITLGANKLKTTNLVLKQLDVNTIAIMNSVEDGYLNLSMGQLNWYAAIVAAANAIPIRAHSGNNSFLPLEATDNDVGAVEVARLQGAADAYLQATLPLRLLPIATASLPATPVEGMIAYDNTLNKLVIYNGSAWETVTSAVP